MPLPPALLSTADADPGVDPLVDVLARCAAEVFTTMVRRPLTQRCPVDRESCHQARNVVGTVGFAGSCTGLVVFSTTVEAAREITAGLLDQEARVMSSRDEVADAIGEVTNMIGGSFRTRMARDGDCWALSVPTVTMGSDFYIRPMASGHRALVSFSMTSHEVCVELILTRHEARR